MTNLLKIKITGKNPEYFFKELLKRKINIYNFSKTKNNLIITVDYKDYLKIKKIKTTYTITIIERFGLSKYKYLLKKYKLYLIFFIIGISINIFLSNIIFNIEVVNQNKILVQEITKDLEELGLKKYHFKVSKAKLNTIKETILKKEKDKVEWLEIEEIGTKYKIQLEERKINEEITSCNARHIVASKNAVIMEIKSSEGEIVKKINDYVEKGEIIISGLIYNQDEIVNKKCAVGTVYGETWYKVKVSLPLNYTETKLTTKKTYGLSIKIFNKEYNFHNKYQNYQKTAYNIIKSKLLPIEVGFSKYEELKIKKYPEKSLTEIALSKAEKEIEKTLDSDESIISKKVLKKDIKNSKIDIEVFVKVKENITAYLDITDINIAEMNKEEE